MGSSCLCRAAMLVRPVLSVGVAILVLALVSPSCNLMVSGNETERNVSNASPNDTGGLPGALDLTNQSRFTTGYPITKPQNEEDKLSMAAILRKVRLEIFKKQLLNKLKMEARPDPAVVPRVKLPIAIVRGHVMTTRRKRPTKRLRRRKQKFILLPSHTETSCNVNNKDDVSPSSCIWFRLKDQDVTRRGTVMSGTLWVYKMADVKDGSGNQTLVMSSLMVGRDGNVTKIHHQGTVGVHHSSYVKEAWVQMDVTALLRKWVKKPHVQHGLRISCKGCAPDSTHGPVALHTTYRPFLVVRTEGEVKDERKNGRSRRNQRSTKATCKGNSNSCCLHPFEISVAELGWDDWIIHPETFQANECRGKCDPSIWTPGMSVRASALREYGYTPCCGVTKMAAVSVIYYNYHGTAVQSNEIKMVAEECDCV